MRFALLELVPCATAVVDDEGVITAANSAFASMLGYVPEELVGSRVERVVVAAAADVSECVHKDGTRHRYAVVCRGAEVDGVPLTSVTLRHEADLPARAQVERMASVGLLVDGAVHELGTALAPVVSNLYVVAQGLASLGQGAGLAGAWLAEPVRDAREGVDRARDLIGDLQAFSRDERTEPAPVEVLEALEAALRLTRSQLCARALLVTELEEVPAVDATVGKLCQVFVNLLINAAQAVPLGAASEHVVRVSTRTDAQGHAVVEVSDTGLGIPLEHQPRVFEPYFTTKPAGADTGPGLWVSARLVTELGGSLELVSSAPRGTCLRLRLPPSQHGSARAVASPPLPTARRVLALDDDRMVVNAIRLSLGQRHEVTGTTDPYEALELLRSGARYDVILCDLSMPAMSGMEFFAALGRLAPDQVSRVVFVTGGPCTENAAGFLAQTPNPKVEKPFSAADLLRLVEQACAGQARSGLTTVVGATR